MKASKSWPASPVAICSGVPDVTVCGRKSRLLQVTFSPLLIESGFGENASVVFSTAPYVIDTCVGPGVDVTFLTAGPKSLTRTVWYTSATTVYDIRKLVPFT